MVLAATVNGMMIMGNSVEDSCGPIRELRAERQRGGRGGCFSTGGGGSPRRVTSISCTGQTILYDGEPEGRFKPRKGHRARSSSTQGKEPKAALRHQDRYGSNFEGKRGHEKPQVEKREGILFAQKQSTPKGLSEEWPSPVIKHKTQDAGGGGTNVGVEGRAGSFFSDQQVGTGGRRGGFPDFLGQRLTEARWSGISGGRENWLRIGRLGAGEGKRRFPKPASTKPTDDSDWRACVQ